MVVINECEGCFKGLFIPIDVLSDNNLNDKEKFIFSIALYYSNVRKTCTLNNENLKDIFGVTKNQISRIVNNLRRKGYTINEYIYKNNHKEILYRKIKPIRKNDDTCILQVLEPICEAKFRESNHGFRPNRGAENAIAQFERLVQMCNLHIVVDIDIKGFFENVNHGKLLKQMWTLGIQDKKLICIISEVKKYDL